MATTNSTTNYELSQYVGSDVTSYLTNYNSDMTKIDAQMKRNADSAATANDNATIAVSTATTAASDASTALSTANTASSTAGAAQTAAEAAQTAAGAAQTDAAKALRASAANSIENLAPAYDPALTYNVGDLVTYIDENNSGKLYKCIVAVTSPEAFNFNINKWDDVTTSEVYETISKEYRVAYTSSDSLSSKWKEAFAFIIANNIADFSISQVTTTGYKHVYNLDEIAFAAGQSLIKLSNVNGSKGGIIYTEYIGYYEIDDTFVFHRSEISTEGNVTNNNLGTGNFDTTGNLIITYK